jgi:hypothetical protein
MTVLKHFRSINQVLKYEARITSLHRKTLFKALKTWARSDSICHKLTSSFNIHHVSVICLLNNRESSPVKTHFIFHGHIHQGTASQTRLETCINTLTFLCIHHILKWRSCFALRYWSVDVSTLMKLQWIPGNKILWCHKWLAQNYFVAGMAQWLRFKSHRQSHFCVQVQSHASHVNIGQRGRRYKVSRTYQLITRRQSSVL